jgi:hypothetical protein
MKQGGRASPYLKTRNPAAVRIYSGAAAAHATPSDFTSIRLGLRVLDSSAPYRLQYD